MGLQLDATVTNVSLEFNWSCGGRHANGRASSAKGKDEEDVEEKDTYQRGRNAFGGSKWEKKDRPHAASAGGRGRKPKTLKLMLSTDRGGEVCRPVCAMKGTREAS